MAPLSFFRSDKSPSTAPVASSSTSPFSNGNSDPILAQTPTPPPSSFTSRLLRRKPSSRSRGNNGSAGSEESPPTSSTSAIFNVGETVRDEDNPYVGERPRRGSEPLKSPGGTNRTAWVYGRHSGLVEEGERGEDVIVINSGGTFREEPDGQGLGDLFRSNSRKYSAAPPSPESTSSRERRHIPVALNLVPTYPTALSPPRRPMPRSPTSSSSSDYPISGAMLPSISAVNGPPPLSPSPIRRPSANAEWLARKPSSRRSESSSSTHNPLNLRLESPRGLGGAVDLRSPVSAPMRTRTTSSSTAGDADASSADSEADGEIGIRNSRVGGNGLGYEVAVACKDERDENGEITWEVKIRPRTNQPSSDEGYNSAIPFNLSTSSSTAISPPTASSINLSLSLDQPTGKLVFIAFPMDIHATPRHRPTPFQTNSQSFVSPPMRPSTPPPSAPRLNSSPPPSTPSRPNVNSMWPSPSAHGRQSPSTGSVASPRGVAPTQRRSRLMNADELGGGLYARGTVDGMSEALESSLSLQYKLGEVTR